jgi:sulfur carrier protein ThiS
MTPTIENHTLTIGDHSEPLPHLPQAATIRVWAVPTEYRESGYFVSVQAHGQPVELPACDAAAAELLATLDLPASEAAQLDAARAERAAAARIDADQLLATLSVSYPEREVSSWPQQVKDAEAIQADETATTPLLDALASARGIDRVDLAARVLTKADAYAQASGAIIGARQRIEDLLEAAQDADAVGAIPTLRELLAGPPA